MNIRNISAASADDVVRILGEMDAEKLVAILTEQPTVEALEIAAAWRAGEELDTAPREQVKEAAEQIYEILTSGEQDDEPPRGL